MCFFSTAKNAENAKFQNREPRNRRCAGRQAASALFHSSKSLCDFPIPYMRLRKLRQEALESAEKHVATVSYRCQEYFSGGGSLNCFTSFNPNAHARSGFQRV